MPTPRHAVGWRSCPASASGARRRARPGGPSPRRRESSRRRSLTTCTSRPRASPGCSTRGQAVGHDDDRPAGLDQGVVGGLGLPLVVEQAPADRRLAVVEQEHGEAARRAGTSGDGAPRRDVAPPWPGTPAWPRATPRRSRSRAAACDRRRPTSAARGGAPDLTQSRSGQRSGSMNSADSGTAWAPNSLTNRTMPGHGRGEAGKVALVALVPPEVEVAVGAVELGRVRQDAGVGDDGAAAVGPLDRPLHPEVEDRAVPRREHLADGEAPLVRGVERLARPRRRGAAARCGRTRRRPRGGARAGPPSPGPGAWPGGGCCGRSPTATGSPATRACPARRPRRTARAG